MGTIFVVVLGKDEATNSSTIYFRKWFTSSTALSFCFLAPEVVNEPVYVTSRIEPMSLSIFTRLICLLTYDEGL